MLFFFLIFNNNGAIKIGMGLGNSTLEAGPACTKHCNITLPRSLSRMPDLILDRVNMREDKLHCETKRKMHGY